MNTAVPPPTLIPIIKGIKIVEEVKSWNQLLELPLLMAKTVTHKESLTEEENLSVITQVKL